MKKFILLSIPALCLSALGATIKLPANFFARQSSLAQGRWVKVAVDTTGVYHLSNDLLREMGFEDPAKVAVFGRGLTPRPDNFISDDNRICVESDLTPTPVMADSTGVYFYGVGPGWQTFVEDGEMSHFERIDKPVYNDRAYYLLTDAVGRTEMLRDTIPDTLPGEFPNDSVQPGPIPSAVVETGVSYLLNDLELSWGFHHSGQIYLGERFTQNRRTLTWNPELPHAVSSSRIALQTAIYTDDAAKNNTMTVTIGNITESAPFMKEDAAQWTNLFPNIINSMMNGNSCPIRASVSGSSEVKYAAVDFWLLSYNANLTDALAAGLPTAVVTPVDTIARLGLGTPSPTSHVWNVADPTAPTVMTVETDTVSNVRYALSLRRHGDAAPRPVLFDALAGVRNPVAWENVANTDLHSRASRGADLLIITVPSLKDQAERIARLHNEHDNMSVMVATVGDIYNEYNSGQPSVMAYKSLIRQLRDAAPRKHLNVLLFGPLRGENKGVLADGPIDQQQCIIAYQSDFIPQKGDSHNINDFLGILDDNISLRPEYSTVAVGVGILPCLSHEEAVRITDKIERYLTDENYAYYCNRIFGVGGSGDFLTHTTQAIEIQRETQVVYDNSLLYTPFFTDATPAGTPIDAFNNYLNEGFPLMTYMGHGGPDLIDKAPGLLYKKALGKNLHNKMLTFGIFGMCDATSPDRGRRGCAEGLILEADNGFIGGIMSTRTAYSNQNSTLTRYFINALRNPQNSSTEVSAARTVGQAYAEARTRMRTLHENTFSLFADPALHIAIPTLTMTIDDNIEATVVPGERMTVTGSVVSSKGNPLPDFNGQVVARLMAPAINTNVVSPTLVTKQTLTDAQLAKVPPIIYDDRVIATYYGEAKDGRWSIDIDPVHSPFLQDGVTTSLYFSTYDRASHTGAAARWLVYVDESSEPSVGNEDKQAPTVDELAYDAASDAINFRISDDRNVNIGADILHGNGLTITVDGKKTVLTDNYTVTTGTPMTVAGTLPCDNLTGGIHTVTLEAGDYAGNEVSESFTFVKGTTGPTCRLTAEAPYSNEESIELTAESLDGSIPSGRLLLASREGTILTSTDFEGNSITLSLTDENGVRLPQGIYKAWIIGGAPGYGYSEPFIFAVLAPLAAQ